MAALRRQLDAMVALLGGRRRIALIDLPVHGNLGDQLIAEGTEALFAAHGIGVVLRMSESDLSPRRLQRLPRDVALVFHGGGNMGDVWPFFEELRQDAVSHCRDHRVLLLPQSIEFTDPAALARAGAVYGTHPDLTLCVRDRPSLHLARARLAADVRLMPDMAHALWGQLGGRRGAAEGTLRLLRRDAEATAAPRGGQDWEDLVPTALLRLLVAHRGTLRLMHRFGPLWPRAIGYRSLAAVRRAAVERATESFLRHTDVETDRLHGSILAALLGQPFRFDDSGNRYDKLSRYWRVWGTAATARPAAAPRPEAREEEQRRAG